MVRNSEPYIWSATAPLRLVLRGYVAATCLCLTDVPVRGRETLYS